MGIFFRRIPLKLFSDCAWVLLALGRYFFFREPIEGKLLPVPFDPGGKDPASAARRALVLALVSLTPNTVSIMIDGEKGRLLIHQLQDTGAEPGDGDEKWPI